MVSDFRASAEFNFSSNAARPRSPTPTWMVMRAPTSRATLNDGRICSDAPEGAAMYSVTI